MLRMRETNDNARTSKVDIQDHSMTDILKNISGELRHLNGRIVDQYQVQTMFIPDSRSVAGEFVFLFFWIRALFLMNNSKPLVELLRDTTINMMDTLIHGPL